MNQFQTKISSALHICVSHYLLMLVLLFGTQNLKAQSNNKIIGYWKMEYLYNNKPTKVAYIALLANGLVKYVVKETKYNTIYKYWLEGNSYCTQRIGNSHVAKQPVNWIGDNEFYITPATSEKSKHYYTRMTQQEFEAIAGYPLPMQESTNFSAQNKPKEKIMGYWKMEHSFFLDYTLITNISYVALLADSVGKSVSSNSNYSSIYQYWVEGDNFCMQRASNVLISKRALYWLSDNEFYAIVKEGNNHYNYTRITKEAFEKAVENAKTAPSPQTSAVPITNSPKKTAGLVSCWSCYDTCEETCPSCGGLGRTKRRVQRSKWDYSEKKYKYYSEDEWNKCSSCYGGKVKCSNIRCSCRK